MSCIFRHQDPCWPTTLPMKLSRSSMEMVFVIQFVQVCMGLCSAILKTLWIAWKVTSQVRVCACFVQCIQEPIFPPETFTKHNLNERSTQVNQPVNQLALERARCCGPNFFCNDGGWSRNCVCFASVEVSNKLMIMLLLQIN